MELAELQVVQLLKFGNRWVMKEMNRILLTHLKGLMELQVVQHLKFGNR